MINNIKITPFYVAKLIGKMYTHLSKYDDRSIEFINGYLDTIYNYESALKSYVIFRPDLEEVPCRRRLQCVRRLDYDKTLFGPDARYNSGVVVATDYLHSILLADGVVKC